MNAPATLESLRRLPVQEQLDFVFQAWDQILDAGWQPTISSESKFEIERRLAAHAADPTRALSWDEALASIRSKS